MPLLWLDPDDGSEVRQLLPATSLPPVAAVLAPGEPEPERCCPELPVADAKAPCPPGFAYTGSPCHAGDCQVAWDGGASDWDAGASRWPCEPEPGPEPEPTPSAGNFIVWSGEGDSGDRYRRYDAAGQLLSVNQTDPSWVWAPSYGQIVNAPDGAVVVGDSWRAQRLVGDASAWVFDDNDAEAVAAVQAGDDTVLVTFVFGTSSSDKLMRLYLVHRNGSRSLLREYSKADLPQLERGSDGSYARPVACVASQDGDVLHVLLGSNQFRDLRTTLVGIDALTGDVLWTAKPGVVEVRLAYGGVARVPGSEALVVGGNDSSLAPWDSGDYRVLVARLDFPSGPRSAPSVTWQEQVHVGDVLAVAADEQRAYVSYADWWGPYDNVLTALDLADGSVAWRYGSSGFGTTKAHALAAAGGRVLLGVTWDDDLFPPDGNGWLLLDGASGAPVASGDFPLTVSFPAIAGSFEDEE